MNKILIVEDEPVVLNNLADLIESSGYETILAKNGEEAIDLVNSLTPDLIISDINMPKKNGYEVLNELQKSEITSSIPFIFLTAKTDMKDLREGMNAGADDYIIKPYDAQELIKAIEIRLGKKQRAEKELENLRNSIAKYVPHELRTPLVAISGYSQFILEDYNSHSSNEIYEMVSRIRAGNLRLHKTIEKFILYSELVILQKDKINLPIIKNQITQDADQVIKDTVIKKSDEFQRRKDLKVNLQKCSLKISENYLRTLISEIIENAFKFSYAENQISICGKNSGEYYKIKIKDNGRGMSQEQINKINAFIQFDREEYQQSGNGLGLIISKMISEIFESEFLINGDLSSFTEVTIKIKKHNN